jgi:DNA-binding MarR family transcriptional regulator
MEDRRKLIEKSVESIYAIRNKIVSEMHLSFGVLQITHSQWVVLRLIKMNGSISIKNLAGLLGTTSSATTQIVDILVSKELLFRKRNPDDRRVLKVALTEKSIVQFDSVKNKNFHTLSSLFDILDDEELLKYCELSSKITNSISAELSEQRAGKKISSGN